MERVKTEKVPDLERQIRDWVWKNQQQCELIRKLKEDLLSYSENENYKEQFEEVQKKMLLEQQKQKANQKKYEENLKELKIRFETQLKEVQAENQESKM